MTHLVDAYALLDAFESTDPHMPQVVFSLLQVYRDHGPFDFDASSLAERMSHLNIAGRLNAEKLAALQPQIEVFFEQTPQGWVPRPGVLAVSADGQTPPYADSGTGERLSRLT
ncbi:MAG TPA: hypothetical protein VEA80_05280 [Vitreimonas sp.]|uniref:hypothetical protein n=1 Tax=Vitreimonas sp. TaxID=3069702 RepID=UPI002D27C3BF|nr:hypothetical protein [Vitreimonas sp.]HYD86865.1 hypothetical protein [Vitreimonas sp.]